MGLDAPEKRGKDGVGLRPRGVLGPPGDSDVECGQRPIVHNGAHGIDDVLKGWSSGCREAKPSQLGGVDDVDVDGEDLRAFGQTVGIELCNRNVRDLRPRERLSFGPVEVPAVDEGH